MDPKLRIVQCPKCRAYLQEPPVGNPFYECGNCFITLQAIHATQEDVERRLQQKVLFKRMEIDKNTKSVSTEDGYKVFTSESSSEKSVDKEEHARSGEGSPFCSPSRREPHPHGSKPTHSSPQPQRQPQQRKPISSFERAQYHPPGETTRAKQEIPQDKIDVLDQDFHRLALKDNDEAQYRNEANIEWANGHGAHHLSMRRSRLEESQENDGDDHHSQVQQMHKSVSFNESMNSHSAGLYRSPSFSDDINQGSRLAPSETEETIEDSIHLILDDFLSARYEARPQYAKVEGYESQRDLNASTDVAEYGTSSRTSSVGEGDTPHAAVVETQSRPLSGEPDGYVVLDHRLTRPGSYQRSSSASRHGQLNSAYHHSADSHERNHSDGERSSPRTHSASKMQLRSTPHHIQQPSLIPHQPAGQSPPHYAYYKPPAGQSYHISHESNPQYGALKSFPFLPRLDEPQVVHCQHCEQLLGVPANLPPTKKAYQKLRCGACQKISVFLLGSEDHFPSPTISPKGRGPNTDFSSAHALHISCPLDAGNRYINHGMKSDSESGDRGYTSIAAGASPRLPPMSRNIPRIPSGTKLSAMTSATTTTAMMGHTAVSNGVLNLHPSTGAVPSRINSPHFGDGMSYRRSNSAYGPHGEHVMSSLGPRTSAGSDYEGHHPHDGRHFQTSSESDNDSPRMRPAMSSFTGEQFHVSSRMPLDRHVAQQYSKDEGYMQETNMTSSMSLKGITRKGAKELTKPKQESSNNLYRRKVTVNGSPIPDTLVKRAEALAGPMYPGSYWYDSQAGFWGVSGGPCLGIIPSHIEELSIQPLSRNCSGGQTGVVVNGRELHKSDYDLLVRRGLPPTPGKTYFVDIDGHVMEAVSGYGLRGLGLLAPASDQTSRGHGMRVS